MRIVRIIARLNVGGPARHVTWLTKGLEAEGFETTLLSGSVPKGEEDMSWFAESQGVKAVFVDEMSRELSLRDLVSLVKIYRHLRRLSPDIVHSHTAKAGTLGRAAALLYRYLTLGTLIGRPRSVKVLHTFHGHVFHGYYGPLKTRFFVTIEKLLARCATDRIIVISPQQLNEINSETGIGRPEQFCVIPLGIDLEQFSGADKLRADARAKLAIDDREIAISYVGRLTAIKNIKMLVRVAAAYRELKDADPPSRFIIAGDGELRAELESESENLGLGNLTFVGNLDDVLPVYAASDIVALTSLNEGTPLSLIEAMAAGRVVISTLAGGVIDLLGPAVEQRDGFSVRERGIGVAVGDEAGFLKGLIYLAKNERLRGELAVRGQEFVHSAYGKERLIADIGRLYREVMTSPDAK